MHFEKPVAISWVAEFIRAAIIGNKDGEATGINEIHKVEQGDIVFVDHPKYYDKCLNSAATHIIINTKDVAVPLGKTLLVVTDFSEAPPVVSRVTPADPQKTFAL